jgi:hypothetical protein
VGAVAKSAYDSDAEQCEDDRIDHDGRPDANELDSHNDHGDVD